MEIKNTNFSILSFAVSKLPTSVFGIPIARNHYFGVSDQTVKKQASEETAIIFQSRKTEPKHK